MPKSYDPMQSIVALFWRIATFQDGPDAVPFSPFLAMALVIANIATATFFLMVLDDGTLIRALTVAVVSLATTAGLVWIVLLAMDLKARFVQTLSALVGTDLLITCLQAGLLPLAQALNQTVFTFLSLASVFWSLGVFGFIFHRSLNVHIGIGMAIAFLFFLLSYATTQAALSAT